MPPSSLTNSSADRRAAAASAASAAERKALRKDANRQARVMATNAKDAKSRRAAASAAATGEENDAEAPVPKTVTMTAQHELLEDETKDDATFESLGLCAELVQGCNEAGWTVPTRIQAAAIPPAAMEQRDIVGIAQTGSGKTGAYVLPMLHWLLSQPKAPYLACLVLVPTRELAQQVSEQCRALGRCIGLRTATLVGGIDAVKQAIELSQRPHVIVGTPGRVKDHLANTKGFSLIKLHWLVLDEADRMLDMDYEAEIDEILKHLPRDRQTALFSATLSTKIDRLQKASLRDPVMVQVDRKNQTADNLTQQFVFCPFADMVAHLHVFLVTDSAQRLIVFCSSQHTVHQLTLTLRILGHRALPLMGRMTQENRNLALQRFKDGQVRVLVCTDLAQRGIDIKDVDCVVNYSLPLSAKEYIHRVGRTARAGQTGKAVNIVSQYDIAQLQSIEEYTGMKMTEYPVAEGDVEAVRQRVEDAEFQAKKEVKEQQLEESATKDERQATEARVARRVRKGSGKDRMAYDDSAGKREATEGGGHGALRMRRENEELYGMTKKTQRASLAKTRRDAGKKR
jgi:ATP-dependent RNA helicase DDX47/RRP3